MNLHKDLILPVLHRERYARLGSRLAGLRQRERMSMEQNAELRWASVQQMLKHAYTTVPFYNRRFKAIGATWQDIRTVEDYQWIPALTRAEILEQFADLRSKEIPADQLREAATGGTTDTPVTLLRDIECIRMRTAVQVRFNEWAGADPGKKVMWLWGARTDYPEKPSMRWLLYEKYVMRRTWCPVSTLNSAVFGSYLQTLNSFRPDVIIAYPTPLSMFAEFLLGRSEKIHRPDSIITTAEATTDTQRSLIEQAFGCKVFSHYGARDFGMIAAECEAAHAMHLCDVTTHVDLRPVEGAGGLHDVLVTDLYNRAMPMIRYQVNDCVTKVAGQSCPCGRGYTLLGRIEGRASDNFTLPNGTTVPGVAMTNRLIKVCPGIRKLQVVQEEVDRFTINYVAGATFHESDLDALRANLRKLLDYPVTVNFERVEDISRERSGKTRICISKVKAGSVNTGGAIHA